MPSPSDGLITLKINTSKCPALPGQGGKHWRQVLRGVSDGHTDGVHQLGRGHLVRRPCGGVHSAKTQVNSLGLPFL